ncbi:MAG: tRNA (adenosine(37)-N6)-threonylcarbamoyltransferase complex dimerization subunit type 1 TsaB [Oscillatoriales cyanobacterium SM2_1_8]|nr:tRNA (adenosine(37)-N6)-threonylcarbamoyltransferase complex dimerization subunit type 1 TsaB [Oscillatoriales cyanobacterium SM2_1_8]
MSVSGGSAWCLGLDTTGQRLRVAITEVPAHGEPPILRYIVGCDRPLGRETSALAHPILQELWEQAGNPPWSTLAFVAVATGPGSFTGTRVGVVSARTLGQQLGTAVFAIAEADLIMGETVGENSEIPLFLPLLEEAWQRWQRGDRPSWQDAYPLYGNTYGGEGKPSP